MLISIHNHSTTNITTSPTKATAIITTCIARKVAFTVVSYVDQNPNKLEANGYISYRNIRYLPTDSLVVSQALACL